MAAAFRENVLLNIPEGKQPWDQLPLEPDRAYREFLKYRNTGPERSYQFVTTTIRLYAGAFCWLERAKAWDRAILVEDEREAKARLKDWAEKEIVTAHKLLKKAEEMLAWPLSKKEEHNFVEMIDPVTGQREKVPQTTTIHPTKWTLRDVATMVETASKLMRLGLGEPLQTVQVNWRDEALKLGIDPDLWTERLTDELYKHLLEGSGNTGGMESGALLLPESSQFDAGIQIIDQEREE